MTEIVKRLAPTGETLREIFLKSGNLCAFPGCGHLNMSANGDFIAQVCHIEAAEEGGERFNKNMSNEDRRQASNLMILCYDHHVETNDVDKFPVTKMQEMKAAHEGKFSHPERAMLEQLEDWTAVNLATYPENFQRYAEMVGGLNEKHLQQSLAEMTSYVEGFRRIPIGTRKFLCTVVKRMHVMKETNVVYKSFGVPVSVLLADLMGALKIGEAAIREKVADLHAYKLGDMELRNDEYGEREWVTIRPISTGWQWSELHDFCEYAKVDLDVFAVNMQFALLDAK